ncbi:GTPase-activating protein [Lecanora helva]
MTELIRDTVFGHFVRLVTGGKVLQYAEEKDDRLWKHYINRDQTRNMAIYGNPEGTEAEKKEIGPSSENSSQTRTGDREERPHNQLHSTLTAQRVDTEKGRDVTMVTWFGDNDPEMPLNWSTFKKVFVTFEICLLTFSIYIGSAIYSAGTEDVEMQFGVSQVKATLGLTLFVAGYGLGPMIWAPFSEVPQIGRNPIYIGTLAVFVIFQVPTALAVNFAMLLCFRFLTGFIGSPVLATGGASIGDMFRPKQRAYGIGIWGISAVCGPVLGPLIGGFAAQHEGWTWTIWELMWLCGFSLVLFIFFLPETSANNILYRRTRRLRKLTGIQSLSCQPEIMAENMTGKNIALIALVRPITLNFQEPIVFLLNLYIALIYGLLYIWFESFPIVFIQIYKFNLSEEGLAFIGILLGAILVIPPFFYYLHKVVEPQFNENGELKPEKRLPPAFVGAFCIPICLFWFGWSARPSVHWIMPIIGSGFFAVGTFLLFNSVLNYLGDAYPEYAASVLAGNDFTRSCFGAGFPLFATAMYKNLGVDWASSTLGFLSIAFIPIPFVLYRYGEQIRKHSKFARKDF